MWLVPPHMAHIFGFCGTWRGPGRCQNFGKSFQIVARANLAAPPVCPLLRRQFVHFCLSISATVFLNISFWICFPLVMDRDFGDWESLQWKKWRILMMIITNFWLVWCNWLINKKLWSEMKRRGGEAWYNVWSGNYLFVFLLKLVRPLSMCTRKSIYIEFNFDPNVGTIFRNDDDLKWKCGIETCFVWFGSEPMLL